MKVLYRLDNFLIKYAGDYVIESNSDNTAIEVSYINPTTSKKTLVVRFREDTFDLYGIADTSTVPADFVPFKYKWSGSEFMLNPTFVDPTAIAADKLASLVIDMPRDLIPNYAELKVASLIEQWKVINERLGDSSPLAPAIRDGLLLLDTPDDQLTADQLANKKAALNLKFKLMARYRIESEVGDPSDLNADNNKQINILTGMVVRMYRLLKLGIALPSEIETNYDAFTSEYAAAVEAGYKDRSDLEDPATLIARLMGRNAQMAQIVEEEYFSKKL